MGEPWKDFQKETAPWEDFSRKSVSNISSTMLPHLQEAVNEANSIKSAYASGGIGLPLAAYQGLGSVGLPLMGAMGGEAVKAGFSTLPEEVQSGLKTLGRGAMYVADNFPDPLGNRARIENTLNQYNVLKQTDPNTARTVASTTNILGGFMPVGGKSALGGTIEALAKTPAAIKSISKVGMGGAEVAAKVASQTFKDVKSGTYKPMAAPIKTYKGAPIADLAKNLTPDDVHTFSGDMFKHAADLGGTLDHKFSNSFIDDVNKIIPSGEWAKTVAGGLPHEKMIAKLNRMRDNVMTLQDATELDRILTSRVQDNVNVFGELNSEGEKFLSIQRKLRDAIESPSPERFTGGAQGFKASEDARRLWSTQVRMKEIQRIIDYAGSKDASNYSKIIQNQFYNIRKRGMAGYSPAQKKLIIEISDGKASLEALRTLSSKLSTIGKIAKGDIVGAAATYGGGKIAAWTAKKLAKDPVIKLYNSLGEQALETRAKWESMVTPATGSPILPPAVDLFGGPNIPKEGKTP